MSAWTRDAEQARALDDLAGKTREQLTNRLVYLAPGLSEDDLRALVAQASSLPQRDLTQRSGS